MSDSSSADRNDRSRGMRVIAGGRAGDAQRAAGEPRTFVVSSRAGDRLEPWALPSSPAVVRVLEQAAETGLDAQLALRLCVEHALVRSALRGIGIDLRVLDRVAAQRRFEQRVDDRDAAYARGLAHTTGTAARHPTPPPSTVGLPLRFSGQLAGVDLSELLRDSDLAHARAWELAALADGRTMSEWAPLAALQARDTRRHPQRPAPSVA